jgi:hypothetical protein
MILAAATFWGSRMSVGLAFLVIGFAWTALGWMGRAEPDASPSPSGLSPD